MVYFMSSRNHQIQKLDKSKPEIKSIKSKSLIMETNQEKEFSNEKRVAGKAAVFSFPEIKTRRSIFRERVNLKLNNVKVHVPFTVAEVAILMLLPVLRLNLLYIALVLIITLTLKYYRFQSFKDFGFQRVEAYKLVVASAIGLIFGLLDNVYIAPYISSLTGQETELGGYSSVKGSIPGFIGLLMLGWIVGGLFEEYFFRGYIFNRVRAVVKNPLIFKMTAILITSLSFAFAHSYQGISGIISCFYFSVVMGLLFFQFKRNTWYLVLIHGFYDTVGITMLYLGL